VASDTPCPGRRVEVVDLSVRSDLIKETMKPGGPCSDARMRRDASSARPSPSSASKPASSVLLLSEADRQRIEKTIVAQHRRTDGRNVRRSTE
jgi:hypothetical protein